MRTLEIIRHGMLDTVQDLGRPGNRKLGVNPGGAMDVSAVRLLNTLLGNDCSAAVIECHFPAASMKFLRDVRFAIGGGDFAPALGDEAVRLWSVVEAEQGSELRFGKLRWGARCYLAVEGGVDVPEWMGGSGTNLIAGAGGHHGRALRTGDVLEARRDHGREAVPATGPALGQSVIPRYSDTPVLRLTKGPEHELLTAISLERLRNDEFSVSSESGRMAMKLKGSPIRAFGNAQIVSSAVDFGTVQLLPDGSLVILMADHQTTGGYPRIGNVIRQDLSIAAQVTPGTPVRFEFVTVDEALRASTEFEKDLKILRLGVRFRSRT